MTQKTKIKISKSLQLYYSHKKVQKVVAVGLAFGLMTYFLGTCLHYKLKAEEPTPEIITIADLTLYAPHQANSLTLPLKSQGEAFKGQKTLSGEEVEKQIRAIAQEADFKWPDYLVKLAYCESRFDKLAKGDSGKSRGIFQIHKDYHPEITDKQAFDIDYATRWTIKQINAGRQHLWTCDRIIRQVAKN